MNRPGSQISQAEPKHVTERPTSTMVLTKRRTREPLPRHAAAPHLTGRHGDEEISFADIAAMPEPEWARPEACRPEFWPGRFMPAALIPPGAMVAILLPDPAAEEMADLTHAIGAMVADHPDAAHDTAFLMTLAPLLAQLKAAELAQLAEAEVAS